MGAHYARRKRRHCGKLQIRINNSVCRICSIVYYNHILHSSHYFSMYDFIDRRNFNILAWSRLGYDRPCAAAVAYLIRKWGMSRDHALDIVSVARIGTNISSHYMEALDVYSIRHSLGDMLCTECTVSGLTKDERCVSVMLHAFILHYIVLLSLFVICFINSSKNQHMKISGMENLLPEAENVIYNKILTASKSSPNYSVVMGKVLEIKSTFTLHRGYVNQPRLMELRMPGRNFDCDDLVNMSEILVAAGVLPQLCLLDLSTNNIKCAGITALCNALCSACPPNECELSSLWLQHNRIGPEGCEAIARLLHPGYMLHTLNVEDNLMQDRGIGTITLSLIVPERDMFDDEEGEPDISHLPPDVQANIRTQQEKQAADDAKYVGNQTITSLNISNNNFSRETMDNIAQVLKTNKTLKILKMDCILTVKPKDIVNFVNSCKVYNRSLTELSMTDTVMPASVVSMIFKVLESNSVLSRLGLARCGLTDLHVLRSVKTMICSKYLTHLNLSGNPLSDGVVPALCSGIEGKIDKERGHHIPPLQSLDLSDCGLTFKGALQVVKTVAGRPCVKHLDLSNNALRAGGEVEMKKFAEALQMSALLEINLNRCQLGTKFSEFIFLSLKSIDERMCGFHLRKLLLSENDIHDSIDMSLHQFLMENTQIQLLDIGFNKLTSEGLRISQNAVKVYSNSSNATKLHDLHINLLGNPCEKEYLMDYPGMARSKVTLRFGHEKRHDPMAHIETELRDHYVDRRKINGDLQAHSPISKIVKYNNCA